MQFPAAAIAVHRRDAAVSRGDPRPLAVCADDYGAAPGIGAAVRELIARRRISATSCIVLAPDWPSEAAMLRPLAADVEVGLHLTLTDYAPGGRMPVLAARGRLPRLNTLIARSLAGRIDREEVAAEIDRQIELFRAGYGRLPDFIDGHQHVHQFPVIRSAVLEVFARRLDPARAWLRYPAMPAADARLHGVAVRRTWAIGALGAGFRRSGGRLGITGNDSFRGVREPARRRPFAQQFRRFLRGLSGRPLIMCHPGFAGEPFDPHPDRDRHRLEEFEWLASADYRRLLADHGFVLAPLLPRHGGGDGPSVLDR